MSVVTISRDQARQLDERAMAECAMPSLLLMENAGRGVADQVCRLGISGPVAICCGHGNNGGDGLVIARHLDLRGHAVRVLLFADPAQLRGDAEANYRILRQCDVPIYWPELVELDKILAGSAWIVDAFLGTGARGEPRSPLGEAIERINASNIPVMAVDLPSGLDCDTGHAARHTIRAAHTCTFVAWKRGFLTAGAEAYTGQIHVVDIGAPGKLVREILGIAAGTRSV